MIHQPRRKPWFIIITCFVLLAILIWLAVEILYFVNHVGYVP